MRRRIITCMVLALLLGLLCVWLIPRKGERYHGLTLAQWESEICHWQPWLQVYCNKTGRWTHWGRKQSVWATWLDYIGIKVTNDWREEMPLLKGDPAAVPILEKLLESQVTQVRLIAAEGLEKVGEPARCAVPALLRALDDKDESVRQQVEQALFRIDAAAAERAGLEWSMMGLRRRAR